MTAESGELPPGAARPDERLIAGVDTTSEPVPARFVERPNRFVAVVELDDGSVERAYLPNTGRLEHLLEPGRALILRNDGRPPRRTRYTVTRAWDGCWVGLEASRAPALLTEWLLDGHLLPGVGAVNGLRAEVMAGNHRLDLLVETVSGPVWVEVKSGGRVAGGEALLSSTPSTRGAAHLVALTRLVAEGEPAAAAVVVQRPDARRLRVGEPADPAWVAAFRAAHAGGVVVVAFGCDVDEDRVRIDRELPVLWE